MSNGSESSNNDTDLDLALGVLREKLTELASQLSSIEDVSENMKEEAQKVSSRITSIAEKLNSYNELRKTDKEYINAELAHLRGKIEEYSKTHHTAGQLSRDLIQLKRILTDVETTVEDLVFKVDEHLQSVDPAIENHEESCAECRKHVDKQISDIDIRVKELEKANVAHEKFRQQAIGARSLILLIGAIIAIIAGVVKVMSAIPHVPRYIQDSEQVQPNSSIAVSNMVKGASGN